MSEIILICWFAAQELFLVIISIEKYQQFADPNLWNRFLFNMLHNLDDINVSIRETERQ